MRAWRVGRMANRMGRSYVLEVFEVPGVALAGPVAGEVCGLLVANRLDADLELLRGRSAGFLEFG